MTLYQSQKPLYLTEGEAMALLDSVCTQPPSEDPAHQQALHKLAELCRDFLREGLEEDVRHYARMEA